MRILSGGAVLVLAFAMAGCTTISTKTSPDGNIKVTSVGVVGCGNPSQRITWVERKGKADLTLGSTGADPCTAIASAAIGAAGQVAASSVLPGSNITVSSGSVNETNTNTNVRVDK